MSSLSSGERDAGLSAASTAGPGWPAAGLPALRRNRWLAVAAASALINTSYGTLSYSFSVLVTDSAIGGEFGTSTVALGFGIALLVSGVAAVFVGTVADVFGCRRLLAIGAVVGAIGLGLLGLCQESWQLIVVMAVVLGPAMAATFYEPVYVLMNRWFAADERPRAYGVLTLLSGVSITIFTPLTRLFVDWLDWRGAVVLLGAILLIVGVLVAAALPEGELPPAKPKAANRLSTFLAETNQGLRHTTVPYWVFTLAFFVASAALSGFSFHMIAQLETRGFDESAVAAAIGITGLVSLPLRLGLPMLAGRVSGSTLLALCQVVVAVAALVAATADEWWQVWVYVAVYGAVFGAVYPLRALAGSERFAGPYFGRLLGIQALLLAFGRAIGPVIIAAIGTDIAGYELGFQLAAMVIVVAALVGWLGLHAMPRVRGVAEAG
jgi:MFS family permease